MFFLTHIPVESPQRAYRAFSAALLWGRPLVCGLNFILPFISFMILLALLVHSLSLFIKFVILPIFIIAQICLLTIFGQFAHQLAYFSSFSSSYAHLDHIYHYRNPGQCG